MEMIRFRFVAGVTCLAVAGLLQVSTAEAASYSRAQCLKFTKQMKAIKAGKPLANADNEARLRFKLNFCLMQGTIGPQDVGTLLD